MKKVLVLLVLLIAITLSANTNNVKLSSDFCDGWEEGYQEALEGCLKVGVTPVCPVAPVGKDTYKHGYGMGYAKGQRVCDE